MDTGQVTAWLEDRKDPFTVSWQRPLSKERCNYNRLISLSRCIVQQYVQKVLSAQLLKTKLYLRKTRLLS